MGNNQLLNPPKYYYSTVASQDMIYCAHRKNSAHRNTHKLALGIASTGLLDIAHANKQNPNIFHKYQSLNVLI